jgi:hypothetical protein
VIDRTTHKITRRTRLESGGLPLADRGKLMVCGCHFTDDQACAELDSHAESDGTSGQASRQSGTDTETVITANMKSASHKDFVAATQDYLVARDLGNRNPEYVFSPCAGGQALKPSSTLESAALDWPASVGSNHVLVRQATVGRELLKLVSLPSGATQALFALPTTPLRVLVPMLHEQTVYVGYGRDLLAYDLKSRRIRRHIRGSSQAALKTMATAWMQTALPG